MSVIQLTDVTKRYDTEAELIEALKAVDFRAERGEMVVVTGPSGSGKSTMLNMIGLLDSPTAGTVHLDGRTVTAFSADERTEARRP